MRMRVIAVLLVLIASVAVNALAMALVFSRGFAFLITVPGLLDQIPFLVVLALLVRFVLARTRPFDDDALGCGRDQNIPGLVIGTFVGAATTTGVGLILIALGAATEKEGAAPDVITALVGLASSLVNAAIQQLTLIGVALAASKTRSLSLGAILLTSFFFVGAHLGADATPLYVANVFAFAVICCALFQIRGYSSWLLPIGFHGGTNIAVLLVTGSPEVDGVPSLLHVVGRDSLWSGGTAGLESGLGLLVMNIALVVVSFGIRARARGRERR
jgi:hypothetical protein